MKKQILFLLSLLYFLNISAQTVDSSPQQVSILNNKSKKQKSTGWILLGGGAGVTLIGAAIGVANVWDEIIFEERGATDAANVMVISGLVSMAGSIPFFIASGKNRKKAAALVFIKMENSSYVSQYTITEKKYPAITLSVIF